MSKYTKEDEERRLCNEWLKDPLTNPKTGMAIEIKGPTYKSWQQQCKKLGMSTKPVKSKEFTFRKCAEWRKTPHINPETGKQITIGGTLYKRIEKACKNVTEKKIQLLGTYFPPDSSGMVPIVKTNNGINYIIRHSSNGQIKSGCIDSLATATADHLVYGPLNSFTTKSQTKLVYFKDTWDYRQGHYRPIFKGTSEPKRPNNSSAYTSKHITTTNINPSTLTSTNRTNSTTARIFNSLLTPNRSKSNGSNGSNPASTVDRLVNLFIAK